VLLSFVQWLAMFPSSIALRESTWMYPIVESVHVLSLTFFVGLSVLWDLCLLAALAVMFTSGFLLFTSEALKCWENGAFWMKMEFLVAALLFTFTARRWYTQREGADPDARLASVVAVVSLALWTGVGIGGRGIGFY